MTRCPYVQLTCELEKEMKKEQVLVLDCTNKKFDIQQLRNINQISLIEINLRILFQLAVLENLNNL